MTSDTEEIKEFLDTLHELEGLADGDISEIKRMVAGETALDLPESLLIDPFSRDAAEARAAVESSAAAGHSVSLDDYGADLRVKIANMKTADKIKLALFGNVIARGILITDTSRMIQMCVLKNPKLREGEVEIFSKNRNLPDMVLREIAKNRNWVKSYTVKINLVTNPKTPGDVALKWLRYLVKADLRRISKSKNIPQLVAVNARKILANMEKKRG